jgi:5-methylcytosine-specific restriction protein A
MCIWHNNRRDVVEFIFQGACRHRARLCLRSRHQLMIEPLCLLCRRQGRLTPATIADHNPPHKGDWNKFRLGPLQSLCRDCHNRKWASDRHGYRSDIGDDGLPTDARHPFNAAGDASGSASVQTHERSDA